MLFIKTSYEKLLTFLNLQFIKYKLDAKFQCSYHELWHCKEEKISP